jgi:hypothetical protein
MTLSFSRGAARVLGPLVIVLESIRRHHQFGDPRAWPSIFDDYLAGGFLLYAALLPLNRNENRARLFLGGAWGVAVGMSYGSFFGQLEHAAQPDPSGRPVAVVLAIKAVGLLLSLAGLIGALRSRAPRPAVEEGAERPAPLG